MGVFNRAIPTMRLDSTTGRVEPDYYVDDIFDPIFNKSVRDALAAKYGSLPMGILGGYLENIDNALRPEDGKWGVFGPGVGILSNFGRSMDKFGDPIIGTITEGIKGLTGQGWENPIRNIFVEDRDYSGTDLLAAMGNSMAKLAKAPELESSDFNNLWKVVGTGLEFATDPGVLGGAMSKQPVDVLRQIAKQPANPQLASIGKLLSDYDDITSKIAIDATAPGLRQGLSKVLDQIKTMFATSSYDDFVDVEMPNNPHVDPSDADVPPSPDDAINMGPSTTSPPDEAAVPELADVSASEQPVAVPVEAPVEPVVETPAEPVVDATDATVPEPPVEPVVPPRVPYTVSVNNARNPIELANMILDESLPVEMRVAAQQRLNSSPSVRALLGISDEMFKDSDYIADQAFKQLTDHAGLPPSFSYDTTKYLKGVPTDQLLDSLRVPHIKTNVDLVRKHIPADIIKEYLAEYNKRYKSQYADLTQRFGAELGLTPNDKGRISIRGYGPKFAEWVRDTKPVPSFTHYAANAWKHDIRRTLPRSQEIAEVAKAAKFPIVDFTEFDKSAQHAEQVMLEQLKDALYNPETGDLAKRYAAYDEFIEDVKTLPEITTNLNIRPEARFNFRDYPVDDVLRSLDRAIALKDPNINTDLVVKERKNYGIQTANPEHLQPEYHTIFKVRDEIHHALDPVRREEKHLQKMYTKLYDALSKEGIDLSIAPSNSVRWADPETVQAIRKDVKDAVLKLESRASHAKHLKKRYKYLLNDADRFITYDLSVLNDATPDLKLTIQKAYNDLYAMLNEAGYRLPFNPSRQLDWTDPDTIDSVLSTLPPILKEFQAKDSALLERYPSLQGLLTFDQKVLKDLARFGDTGSGSDLWRARLEAHSYHDRRNKAFQMLDDLGMTAVEGADTEINSLLKTMRQLLGEGRSPKAPVTFSTSKYHKFAPETQRKAIKVAQARLNTLFYKHSGIDLSKIANGKPYVDSKTFKNALNNNPAYITLFGSKASDLTDSLHTLITGKRYNLASRTYEALSDREWLELLTDVTDTVTQIDLSKLYRSIRHNAANIPGFDKDEFFKVYAAHFGHPDIMDDMERGVISGKNFRRIQEESDKYFAAYFGEEALNKPIFNQVFIDDFLETFTTLRHEVVDPINLRVPRTEMLDNLSTTVKTSKGDEIDSTETLDMQDTGEAYLKQSDNSGTRTNTKLVERQHNDEFSLQLTNELNNFIRNNRKAIAENPDLFLEKVRTSRALEFLDANVQDWDMFKKSKLYTDSVKRVQNFIDTVIPSMQASLMNGYTPFAKYGPPSKAIDKLAKADPDNAYMYGKLRDKIVAHDPELNFGVPETYVNKKVVLANQLKAPSREAYYAEFARTLPIDSMQQIDIPEIFPDLTEDFYTAAEKSMGFDLREPIPLERFVDTFIAKYDPDNIIATFPNDVTDYIFQRMVKDYNLQFYGRPIHPGMLQYDIRLDGKPDLGKVTTDYLDRTAYLFESTGLRTDALGEHFSYTGRTDLDHYVFNKYVLKSPYTPEQRLDKDFFTSTQKMVKAVNNRQLYTSTEELESAIEADFKSAAPEEVVDLLYGPNGYFYSDPRRFTGKGTLWYQRHYTDLVNVLGKDIVDNALYLGFSMEDMVRANYRTGLISRKVPKHTRDVFGTYSKYLQDTQNFTSLTENLNRERRGWRKADLDKYAPTKPKPRKFTSTDAQERVITPGISRKEIHEKLKALPDVEEPAVVETLMQPQPVETPEIPGSPDPVTSGIPKDTLETPTADITVPEDEIPEDLTNSMDFAGDAPTDEIPPVPEQTKSMMLSQIIADEINASTPAHTKGMPEQRNTVYSERAQQDLDFIAERTGKRKPKDDTGPYIPPVQTASVRLFQRAQTYVNGDIVRGKDFVRTLIQANGGLMYAFTPGADGTFAGYSAFANSLRKNISRLNANVNSEVVKLVERVLPNGNHLCGVVLNTSNPNIVKVFKKHRKEFESMQFDDLVRIKPYAGTVEDIAVKKGGDPDDIADIQEIYRRIQELESDYARHLGITPDESELVHTKHVMRKDAHVADYLANVVYKDVNTHDLDELCDSLCNLDGFRQTMHGSFGSRKMDRRLRGDITDFEAPDMPIFEDDLYNVAVSTLADGAFENEKFQAFVGLFNNPNFRIGNYCSTTDDLKSVLYIKNAKGRFSGNFSNLELAAPRYDTTGRLIGFTKFDKLTDVGLQNALRNPETIIVPSHLLAPLDAALRKEHRLSNSLYSMVNKLTIPFKFGVLTNPGFILGNASDAYLKQATTYAQKYGTSVPEELGNVMFAIQDVIRLNNRFDEIYRQFLTYAQDVNMDLPPNAFISSQAVDPRISQDMDLWLARQLAMEEPGADEIANTVKLWRFLNSNGSTTFSKGFQDMDALTPRKRNKYDLPENIVSRITMGKGMYDKKNPETWGLFVNNPIAKFFMDSSESVENLFRSSAILNDLRHKWHANPNDMGAVLRQADSVDFAYRNKVYTQIADAINTMHNANFDYERMSNFSDALGTFVPFPTFFVKNFAYWMELFLDHPEYVKRALMIQRGAWSDRDTKDDKFMAEAKGRGAVPIGKPGLDGFFKGVFKPSPLQSMFGAFNMLNDPMSEMYYRLHPAIQSSIAATASKVPVVREGLGKLTNPEEEIKYRPYSTDPYEKNINIDNPKFNPVANAIHRANPVERGLQNALRTPAKIREGRTQLSDFLPSVFQPDFSKKETS